MPPQWQEWFDMKLYLMAKGTPLMEKGYKGVFEQEMSKEIDSVGAASYAHFHDAVLNVLFI